MYLNGERIKCPQCFSHIATFKRDAALGERISELMFDSSGQGPWRWGDELICRACKGKIFADGKFILTESPVSATVIETEKPNNQNEG